MIIYREQVEKVHSQFSQKDDFLPYHQIFQPFGINCKKKNATCAQEDATKTNPEDKKDESFDADSYEFSAYLDKKEGLLSDQLLFIG